nr:CBN-SRB-17 protein [Haemonchus contortus]
MLFFALSFAYLAYDLINIGMKVLLNAFVLLVLFYGQNFDELYLNGRMFPTAIYIRVNVLFITLLGLNFTGFVFTIALQLLRPKRRIQMPLSSKFQSNENTIASTLLFWITTFQFALYGTSQGVVIFIRIYAPQNPMAIAYKENSDFFNFLTLAMPILSTYYFRKVKRRRIDCLRNQIEMKSNGNDGWTNYSTVIGKQWNK